VPVQGIDDQPRLKAGHEVAQVTRRARRANSSNAIMSSR
jgi:hypothetical protein